MKNVTVRLEPDVVDDLDRVADDRDVTRSEYIRDLVERGLDGELNTSRDQVDDLRDRLADKRVEAARLDAENERLQSDVERIRDERDSLKARYHEAHTKLKLHNSEKSGVLDRLTSLFS